MRKIILKMKIQKKKLNLMKPKTMMRSRPQLKNKNSSKLMMKKIMKLK